MRTMRAAAVAEYRPHVLLHVNQHTESTMKARLALAALMTVATLPLAAQGQRGMGRQLSIDNLTTMYSLSAEQKTKTEALLATYTDATKGVQAWMMKGGRGGRHGVLRSTPLPDSTRNTTDARGVRCRLQVDLTAPRWRSIPCGGCRRRMRPRAEPRTRNSLRPGDKNRGVGRGNAGEGRARARARPVRLAYDTLEGIRCER